jgi:hypothetical protein
MDKKQLKDRLKKISAQIMKAKIEGKSTLKLQSEFYRYSKPYKKLWLEDYKRKNNL